MKIRKIGLIFVFLMSVLSSVQAQNSASSDIKPNSGGETELGAKSPNELPGYKFFADGKLKDLKLGISTKKDVENVLGKPRQTLGDKSDVYDYDSEWFIHFRYYDELTLRSVGIPFNLTTPEKNGKWVPLPESIGKLYNITLYSKKVITLKESIFSNAFKKQTIPVTDQTANGRWDYNYNSYQDSYGLEYQIFAATEYADPGVKHKRINGQLMNIEYNIPYKLRQSFFALQKQ